ncbi:penicillin-binding protein 1C [Plasticicumulans lactativorans]|uniref:penicillin-binding protein 1C n=1 Tax=Plasticicumulans lactativorans TaxID=1133106 RepID=UPI001FB48620|nr:penicillin-binding protein 1C [Plasticicumulans lactativorans]
MWRSVRLLVLAACALLALDHLFPPDLGRLQRVSVQLLDADGVLMHVQLSADGYWRLPLSLDAVDPRFVDTLVAFEDRRFWWHPGVDPLALVRAAGQWLRHGRVVSGGSTLTMQLARLLEPRPRTLRTKLVEIARALQLEWHYDKRQLLSMYLTLAPYGGNVEGLRAASLVWLGKEPRALSAAEAALLAALPQSPSRLRPDRHARAAGLARDKVLGRVAAHGGLAPGRLAEALAEPVPSRRLPLPRQLPHLAAVLQRERPAGSAFPTSVRRELQRGVAGLAARALEAWGPRVNAAILVVDHRQRRVLAYLGAADTGDPARGGQLDLVRALRSPGSTLKPLVYGLGFEDGVIQPGTRIDDVPTRFGDYAPANFQDRYHGEVSAREALQWSLNVPAVAVFEQVGPARTAARLRAAGIELRLPAGAEPGLPLVLGGVGTRLWDLVTLYAALAEDGEARPLRLLADAPEGAAVSLLSARAAGQVARILEDAPPPPEAVAAEAQREPRRIAYKTGTSYGFRDAWAIGFDGAHTVGVWVGRADGSPSPGQFGRNTAAPLLWRVFDLLPAAPRPNAPAVAQADAPARLPARWQRLGPAPAARSALAVSFPLDGSRLPLPPPGAELPLVAQGGERPLRWLVNGVPLAPAGLRRSSVWLPDGAGRVRATVIDARGRSASAEFWLERPAPWP